MFKKSNRLLLPLAAFYTIWGFSAAHAQEQHVQSTRLLDEITRTKQQFDQAGRNSLIADYVYSLELENATPTEQLKALQKLCSANQSLAYGIFAGNWLTVLRNYRINNFDDIHVMQLALMQNHFPSPKNTSCEDAQKLLQLATQIDKFETTSEAQQITKAEALIGLSKMMRSDRYFGRRIANLALKNTASNPKISVDLQRDLINLAFSSFNGPYRQDRSDGALLLETVTMSSEIANEFAKNHSDVPLFMYINFIFSELANRCSTAETVKAMEVFVPAVTKTKVEKQVPGTLQSQLGYSYMLNKNWEKAEMVFSTIRKATLLDRLCLAECLRMQRKYAQADRIARAIKNVDQSKSEEHPSQFVAIANAIRAQCLIDREKFKEAEKLLEAADQLYAHGFNDRNFPFRYDNVIWKIIPGEQKILTNLILVSGKLNKKEEFDSISKQLQLALNKNATMEAMEKKQYVLQESYGLQQCSPKALDIVKVCIEFCAEAGQDPTERAQLLLDYGESLIRKGAAEAAEACFDACKGSIFIDKKNEPFVKAKVAICRMLNALYQNKNEEAKQLNVELVNQYKIGRNKFLYVEASSKLATAETDYSKAEQLSRVLQEQYDFLPLSDKDSLDKFLNENRYAIIDRVQTLMRLNRFDEAASLNRKLLQASNRQPDPILAAGYANLALAYQNTNHPGLAKAAQQISESGLELITDDADKAYIKDAYQKLSELNDVRQNSIRQKRYQKLAE